MPFYEYECVKCSHRTEKFHGINATPEVKCDECSGDTRKVFFAPTVIFKGSGFYATEYGKSTHNNPNSASSKDKAKAESAGGDSSKNDDKPAASAESKAKAESKPESKTDSSSSTAAPKKADGKAAA